MAKGHARVKSTELQDMDTNQHLQDFHTAAAWPTQPKPLALSRQEQFILAAYDILLIVMPVLLIIKTGIVILGSEY